MMKLRMTAFAVAASAAASLFAVASSPFTVASSRFAAAVSEAACERKGMRSRRTREPSGTDAFSPSLSSVRRSMKTRASRGRVRKRWTRPMLAGSHVSGQSRRGMIHWE